ncbi:MAG: OmpA family protein [Saprospiraceae bacterium]|nr:OmpA family protein [Saprospiraceae bacterium]MCB0575952.1 OmpA family protein [Saprospiraceae bacterium]MCB9306327.1 OmpA family protein [Lewinellaceae bacterium]MCB9353740.1 OmpA family protein [Lewinellaceae bacterium]
MARLTSFSKFLITLLIVGAVFFVGRYFMNNTEAGQQLKDKAGSEQGGGLFGGSSSSDPNTIGVGVVTWGGYAGGQYWNKGFKPNSDSRFNKDYGFNVEFKILDDPTASRNAWKNDEVQLLWATIDALPTEMPGLAAYDPVVVFQADWSRGGDAIVVRRGIGSVGDLRGKKIAVAELSPSHSFLIWLLSAAGMTTSDVQVVGVPSPIEAADAFKANNVDAAVVWSPFDEECVQKVPGARVLQSTRNASNIIADVFIAKRAWVERNRERVQQLYEGWMKGAAEINRSPAAKQEAAQILAESFDGFTKDDALKAIDNVRLCTHGDNLNFFGLNRTAYKGVTGEELYARMTKEYRNAGVLSASDEVPVWSRTAYFGAVEHASLSGNEHAAEGQKTFASISESEAKNKTAVATKRVSISFRTGEYQLDENAKYIVDNEMVPIAKAFANSRVRVEGNTDNVGSAASNVALSKRRAQSVVDYLVKEYGMPRSRFIVIGNGPDNPVAGNDNEEGRRKNRRTDFELVEE